MVSITKTAGMIAVELVYNREHELNPPWTLAQIIEHLIYTEDMNVNETAVHLGVSDNTLRIWMTVLNVPRPGHRQGRRSRFLTRS